jgi:hypothetical protein
MFIFATGHGTILKHSMNLVLTVAVAWGELRRSLSAAANCATEASLATFWRKNDDLTFVI